MSADRTRGYAIRLEVQAPPSIIWSSLTNSSLTSEWRVSGASIDARPGGSFKYELDAESTREAHIDLFMPPSRLRLIYLPQTELAETESVIVDDFIIDSKPGQVTRLNLLGSGFPRQFEFAEFFKRVQADWTRSLNRLKVRAEKRAAALPK